MQILGRKSFKPYREAYMKRRDDRPCEGCGRTMKNPRPNKKFCNPKCKAAHYNEIYRADGRLPPLVGDK